MIAEKNAISSPEKIYFSKSPDALRTIGEVAAELGLASHVLRFWESKFKQIRPQKRRGRRYYRSEDIQTIQQIKILLYQKGYTIRVVQKFLSHNLQDPGFENDNIIGHNTQTIQPSDNTTKSLSSSTEYLKTLHDNLERFKYKLQNKL